MLNCMRVPMLLLAAFAVTLPSIPARAQDSARASIMQAYELWRGGQPKAAIAILEPVLRQDTLGFTEEERGAAWDILGSSYQDLETFDRARQAYGKAIDKLCDRFRLRRPNMRRRINNFATLEQTLGEKDSAKALSKKAERIYEQLGDPAGDRHRVHQSCRDCVLPEGFQDGATLARNGHRGSASHHPIEGR